MTAWQSHDEGCECSGCEHERQFIAMMTEMPESPTLTKRFISAIKEALAWATLIAVVLLLARCSQ
jgi:ABC-type nitrate/sulfonate/bicarbonate transport system substrate-binding protein